MATLFAIGSVMFWVLLGIYLIVATIFIEKEEVSNFGAFATTAAFVAILYFCGAGTELKALYDYAVANPGSIILGAVLYVVAGIIWSFVKWYLYLANYKKDFIKRKASSQYVTLDVPRAAYHRFEIISWLSYWPLSLTWFAINKPFRRFFNWLYEQLSGTYERIADSMFKGLKEEEMQEKEQKAKKA